ncbi:uncharacterized protein A4U43_C08F3540 [Asparagus officinalis]|uniref:novel plant SNARE 11-like n=1 Tax=Asparagus officinalis TaxID=4686 RepID=UPI00098E4F04|nr:novel plant SNARE 11-like [Asparagus officinalis]XP_020276965.1 novel plant SNARE 11-like [Asparagus officinalis]XP_020276966.1 novel plant SNARE 11-like [Asparagus officinalis]XP_020276967.1 novel plant SNARE 11-like [Asparagus officinalis]XP_020276968.1 novel plant SNARE 11-like [Asparagus officinalis]ONK59154.1 uncharacterized protein A4U43_C08F3540 [Asparagus officinalis]
MRNGFQKLGKVKDPTQRSRQLEELAEKMRKCKRLIKEFDRAAKAEEGRSSADTSRMLSEKKQSMIKELSSYVALKERYAGIFDANRVDLFDAPGTEGYGRK